MNELTKKEFMTIFPFPSLGFAGGVMLAASYWSLLGITGIYLLLRGPLI